MRGFTKLEPGALLCMYSDGIVEAHNVHDQEFGMNRLLRIVRANREKSAQEIVQNVLAAVAKWGRENGKDRNVQVRKGRL